MSDGHCRHCDPNCGYIEAYHGSPTGAIWDEEGGCPACAEAERIAAWCEAEAARREARASYGISSDHGVDGLERAAKIARGDA